MTRGIDAARVTAIVPCHRDAPDRALLRAIRRHVGRVLVVLDRVDPASVRELAERSSVSTYDVLELRGGSGKGSAVSAALDVLLDEEPPPRAVIVVDADGQHPPDAIPAFLAAGRRAELVIGDRFGDLARMPTARRIANVLASNILSMATGAQVRDSQCGMRLLRGRALDELRPPAGGYEAETRHLRRCLSRGVAVAWVPIPAIYDGERSSFRALRDGFTVLRACFL